MQNNRIQQIILATSIILVIFITILSFIIFSYEPNVTSTNCDIVKLNITDSDEVISNKVTKVLDSCVNYNPLPFEDIEITSIDVNPEDVLNDYYDIPNDNIFTGTVTFKGLFSKYTSVDIKYTINDFQNIYDINELMDHCSWEGYECYSTFKWDEDTYQLLYNFNVVTGVEHPEDIPSDDTHVYLNDDYSIKSIDEAVSSVADSLNYSLKQLKKSQE